MNSILRNYTQSSAIKKKICVIGGGPAGFYAAQYLVKNLPDAYVDIIEKLPIPFGLVRFGVAPDHPEVKNVINTFIKTAEHDRVNFYGNLSLGKDFSLRDLRDRYHAVLLAYGANEDRQLEIPNESQPNVISAREFVAWYNGLPGAAVHLNPDLSGKVATIVGQGNVAVDVARILLSPIDALRKTDITAHALDALAGSKIQQVNLVGRRGPLQAAFTIKELREMLKLPNCGTQWREQNFIGIPDLISELPRPRKRLTELMLKSMTEKQSTATKSFHPIFYRSPHSIQPNGIQFNATTLAQNNSALNSDEMELLESDLVLRSIGYKSSCVDCDINFNVTRGNVHNENGRVLTNEKSADPGLYVTGWLGTGPTGVILTTMNNSFGVADIMCNDFKSNAIPVKESKPGLDFGLTQQSVTWDRWKKIDATEVANGARVGKPREKIVILEEMLKVAGL